LIAYLARSMERQKLIRVWRRNYRRHLRALQKQGLSSWKSVHTCQFFSCALN